MTDLHRLAAEFLAAAAAERRPTPERRQLDDDLVECHCHPSLIDLDSNGGCLRCRRPVLELIVTPAVRALVADPTFRPDLRGNR